MNDMIETKDGLQLTTGYGKNGKPVGVPQDFTGHLLVWGFDCVPDHFRMVNGQIVSTIFRARGDWTRI